MISNQEETLEYLGSAFPKLEMLQDAALENKTWHRGISLSSFLAVWLQGAGMRDEKVNGEKIH